MFHFLILLLGFAAGQSDGLIVFFITIVTYGLVIFGGSYSGKRIGILVV